MIESKTEIVARRLLTAASAFTALLLSLCAPGSVGAQTNDLCLMCHSNPSLFESNPRGTALVVTQEMLGGSVHSQVGCTDCHQGLAFPHPEEIPPPTCGLCHDDQTVQHGESLHGLAQARGDTLAPSCSYCHGTHEMLGHLNPQAPTYVFNIPLLCGQCHHEGTEVTLTHDIPQDQILENYSLSIHGEGLFRQGLTVTAVCTSCHTSHFILPHTDPRSSIHESNVPATCTQCHALIEEVHQQFIEGRLWEAEPHKIPVCVDCHSPHKIRRVFYDAGVANQDCFGCHSDPRLTMERDGQAISLYVDEQAYSLSMHSGTGCAQCHTDVAPSLLARPCSTSVATNVDCAICHPVEVEAHNGSIHGQLVAEGDPDSPACLDCHDNHATLGQLSPASPTYPRNVPDLCARCHREGEPGARRLTHDSPLNIINKYEMSIHGKGLLESGLVVTATCSSCHGPHHVLPAEDPASLVHRDNVTGTCGTCHHGIEEIYQESVHWVGREEFDPSEHEHDLPTCENCHTSHTISRTDRTDFRLSMMDQCGRCHTEESETFFDTFHGKVSRLGDAGAAKCYDCHGTHNILPTTEPGSTLSRRNIIETCAQCHPGANRKFTGYLTHATHHDAERYPFLFWAFWGMTALLVGTLSFATLHTLAWLFRMWRSPGEWVRHKPVEGEALYRRFTTFERSLHLTMLISFFVLAITGMILKFSYTGWAQSLASFVGGFATTGVLHRMGAIVLITVFMIHLIDVFMRKQASKQNWREFIFSDSSLMFNRNDLREFIGSIKWFLGWGSRPKYGRFTYWEKFDYFAVFWGMFIIGSTGLLLWFPELFTVILPGWTVNVATILHSDEALLAVAFIFTIHFFNTHFRPDKFPMDPVIFTGRVPVEELKHDKPREYEKLVEAGKLEEYLVHPYPKKMQRLFRVFGFSALAVGLIVIFLILYSMLSVYM
jgi:cytochrome b subunit of formate dehydrogenase